MLQGSVVMLATVDKSGDVHDIQIVSGPVRFRDAASTAVKQWKYRPYVVDGQAVEVQTSITLVFAPPH